MTLQSKVGSVILYSVVVLVTDDSEEEPIKTEDDRGLAIINNFSSTEIQLTRSVIQSCRNSNLFKILWLSSLLRCVNNQSAGNLIKFDNLHG